MQFEESSIRGKCANPYCQKGADGKRAEVSIRDTRGSAGYCSKSCAAMRRYKDRYQGTMAGPVDGSVIIEKMNKL